MSCLYQGIEQLVTQLSEGEEIRWEPVRKLAKHGLVSREAAFMALAMCLRINIPKYRSYSVVEKLPGTYWANRLGEELDAWKSLRSPDCDIASYRGIPLQKDSNISSMIRRLFPVTNSYLN